MANEILIPVKYVVDDSDLTKAGQKVGALTAEEKKLESEMNDVAAAARRQASAFNQAETAGTNAAKNTEKQYNMLGNSIGNIGAMIAGAFAVDRLLAFGSKVIEVTATFQKLSAVLTTSLGSSSAANLALARIQAFAAETPYSVEQVTASFVKLAARGFQPTNAELKKLGDLAASTGKDFDQLTEALLDAQTGEFERLKEFGITARSEGDKVKFTFGETTTEVQKTNEAIKDYVLSLGDLEQVSGSAAAISETLGGKINNLGDTFDQFFKTIGEGSSGVMVTIIDQINKFISLSTKLIDPIGTATKEALSTVSDFEFQINKSFENIAKKTKAEGGNVNDAVALQAELVKRRITAQLAGAQQALDAVNEKVNNIPEALRAFGLPKGLETQLANSTANVKRLEAQLTALDGVVTKRQKDQQRATNEQAAKDKEAADKAAKDAEDAFKKRDKSRISYMAASTDSLDQLTADTQKSLEEQNKAFDKNAKDQIKRTSDRIDEDKKLKDAARVQEEKDEKAHQERVEAIKQEAVQFALFAADAFVQFQTMQSQERIAQLEADSEREQALTGDNFAARERIEKEYNEKIKKEKAEQAKREKALSLFNIAVNTATGVIKAVSESPLTFGLPFSAFILAQGAIQAALVASQPIPKFAKGTRSVTGGRPGEDSVLAMLMPGERVITTEKNRQLSPAFDVLTNSKHSPQFLNKALMEIEKLGMFVPPKLSDLSTGAGAGGIDTDRLIAAIRGIPIERTTFDERGVVRYTESQQNRIRRLNKRYGL